LSPVNFLHDHSTESDSPVLKLAETHSSVSKTNRPGVPCLLPVTLRMFQKLRAVQWLQSKAKAVHEGPWGRGGIAPTHSRPPQ
jgi:hypothetical protein